MEPSLLEMKFKFTCDGSQSGVSPPVLLTIWQLTLTVIYFISEASEVKLKGFAYSMIGLLTDFG